MPLCTLLGLTTLTKNKPTQHVSEPLFRIATIKLRAIGLHHNEDYFSSIVKIAVWQSITTELLGLEVTDEEIASRANMLSGKYLNPITNFPFSEHYSCLMIKRTSDLIREGINRSIDKKIITNIRTHYDIPDLYNKLTYLLVSYDVWLYADNGLVSYFK